MNLWDVRILWNGYNETKETLNLFENINIESNLEMNMKDSSDSEED